MALPEHTELQELAMALPEHTELAMLRPRVLELGTERLLPTKEVCLVGWRAPFWVVALMELMERMELAMPAMDMVRALLAMGLALKVTPTPTPLQVSVARTALTALTALALVSPVPRA